MLEITFIILFVVGAAYIIYNHNPYVGFQKLYLNQMSEPLTTNIIDTSYNLLSNTYGVKKPVFKLANLSGANSKTHNITDGTTVYGSYDANTKLILIDRQRMLSDNVNWEEFLTTITHEFGHYVDDVSHNLNLGNTISEILENRAEKFAEDNLKKVSKEVLKVHYNEKV